jgi:hypothetical protein
MRCATLLLKLTGSFAFGVEVRVKWEADGLEKAIEAWVVTQAVHAGIYVKIDKPMRWPHSEFAADDLRFNSPALAAKTLCSAPSPAISVA